MPGPPKWMITHKKEVKSNTSSTLSHNQKRRKRNTHPNLTTTQPTHQLKSNHINWMPAEAPNQNQTRYHATASRTQTTGRTNYVPNSQPNTTQCTLPYIRTSHIFPSLGNSQFPVPKTILIIEFQSFSLKYELPLSCAIGDDVRHVQTPR